MFLLLRAGAGNCRDDHGRHGAAVCAGNFSGMYVGFSIHPVGRGISDGCWQDRKYLEYLNLEAEKTKGDSFTEMTKGVIEFRNVSFRYPGTKELVLDHVSLKIEPSEKIAVVGKNGSGKTTLRKASLQAV